MNNLSKEQKKYFFISLAAAAVLLVVVLWQHPAFIYKDTTDYAKHQQKANALAAAYAKYLQNVQTDPKASQALFQEILTKQDIENEVKSRLQTSRVINPPVIDEKNLNVSGQTGRDAVMNYLTAALPPLVDFNKNTLDANKQLFAGDSSGIVAQYGQTYKKIAAAPVPKESLDVQKDLLAAYTSYGKLLDLSQQFVSQQTTNPWADVYEQYAAMNQSFNSFAGNYGKLVNKYKLADEKIIIPADYAKNPSKKARFALVPKALAIFGLGDVTVTIGDIPRIIMDAVQQGLIASFSQFMSSFLAQVVQKIESNYMIANFLYYSDALVSGQYANDYLNKYVPDQLDRQVVKKLLPQFACGKNEDLKPLFQAKASQYLGFDPQSVSPNDPNYYQKLSSVGGFLASPEGWQIYYEDLAAQTESQSQQAVDRELTSSGLKTPRDSLTGSITTSINSIVSGEKAGLEAILQLGNSSSGTAIGKFAAEISQTLFTKFLFNGATTNPRNPSSIGVLKEQSTCLAAAQLTAIVPIAGTQYQQPPPPPNAQDLLNQTCAQLPRGCTTTPATITP